MKPDTISNCEVCIDAGHGGNDNGSNNGKRLDKNDNLNLALLLYKYLNDKGVAVSITRNTDTALSLQQRKDMAEHSGCKLFISIHRNLYEKGSSINGAEAWIHSSNPSNANSLATSILEDICDSTNFEYSTFDNRGVKTGSMTDSNEDYAINKVSMTSLILEMGFITSPYDNESFDNNMNKYAEFIGKDIIDFLNTKH